jgi:hypothetical protein
MRKSRKSAAPTQLGLFTTISQIPQLPGGINPKLVALLARLLRQYGERQAIVGQRPESRHE